MQQWQLDQCQQLRDVALAALRVVLDPGHQRVKHFLLVRHVQVVAAQQIGELGGVQHEELLVFPHLLEVLAGVGGCQLQQGRAALLLGKQRKPETVGRM